MPFRFLACFLLFLSGSLCLADSPQTNVTLLIPGFTVRELPVRLSNVNNLRFSPKGELTALGYDGRVHILRDTDGDGVEDQDVLFWASPTITVPVGMAWAKEGLYVSSHGKVSLLSDTDGDGLADREQVIASDWPPTDVASGGVDASAVTLDAERNLYFGLLTSDYSNPYRVKDGVSRYDLNSRRGTIQKWVRATGKLETLANGIRVPYTLAFNRAGDLFVTDQEGETWCPGGNPRDELNQIILGKNYGFPPRHPVYLPSVVSEPPVVAFSPQHQSSCGLIFNESSERQKLFGPADWEGDAFVAGESRGKIWRVRLSKIGERYVGQETLFARLNMLTTDVAISPQGDLYVSCHSGKPDWGTGPKGEGKLFKISYTHPEAARPVIAWAVNPLEMRVAFDKPVDPEIAKNPERVQIDFGEYVQAADRLEVLKPPYKVVEQQEATPRGKLRVVAAKMSPDRRTLELTTDPHPQNVGYALAISLGTAAGNNPAIDLAYNLFGIETTLFKSDDKKAPLWSGWLPHIDASVDRRFLNGSAEHERFFENFHAGTVLQLRSALLLPPGATRLVLEANGACKIKVGNVTAEVTPGGSNLGRAEVSIPSGIALHDLTIEFRPAEREPVLHLSYATDIDATLRPAPFNAFQLPWAPPHIAPPPSGEAREITGGDFERGRSLFTGERLKCSSCHRLRGEGALVGPDLSNLIHRDAASVLRDIKEPSASINPDYVAYNVTLADDEAMGGFVRSQSESELRIVSADGHERIVPRAQVKQLQVSAVSLMPAGLLDSLQEGEIRDLLTFLLNEAPVREPSDLANILKLKSSSPAPASLRDLKIVLVASKQDHGPAQHDYPAWQKNWPAKLEKNPGVHVETAWEWPSDDQIEHASVLVFYFWNHDWNSVRYEQLDKFFARGGGAVILHSATIADQEPEKLAKRFGLASQPGPTKYRHTPLDLNFSKAQPGSITEGFTRLHLLDEPYWPMLGDTNRVNVLAATEVDGQSCPMIWTYTPGKGRVFASIPCHYTWTWSDPVFGALLFRGIAWAAGEPPDRFDPVLAKTAGD